MNDWTWKCGVCGKERADEDISVLTYPFKDFPGAEINLKYCNDSEECWEGAKQKSSTGKL